MPIQEMKSPRQSRCRRYDTGHPWSDGVPFGRRPARLVTPPHLPRRAGRRFPASSSSVRSTVFTSVICTYSARVYTGNLSGDALAKALGMHLITNRASLRSDLEVCVPWELGGSPSFAAAGALVGRDGVVDVVYEVAVRDSAVDEVQRRLALVRDHVMASTPLDQSLPTVWLLLPAVCSPELMRCGRDSGRRGYYVLYY